jgi:uncharacterized protein YbjT (DUF2867 family)
MNTSPVMVTGSTGYIGGRLVPLLLERGHRVRAVGRSLDKIRARPWGGHPNLEVAAADLHDPVALAGATRGCRCAYYLVHSMHAGQADFAAAERRAAYNMVHAAQMTGLERIIYLSGLGQGQEHLSRHLRSRFEVGRILRLSPARVTILGAAMVLGSGSASFELLRYLTQRLPVMITPRWVRTRVQPIAISDTLEYLAGCLEKPETAGRDFDIGGPEVTTYQDLFQEYARIAGLRRRLVIPVPLLTPRLSSLWVHLMTPLPPALARPLVEGLSTEVVCRENAIGDIIPLDLVTPGRAMQRAHETLGREGVPTCWSDAGNACVPEWAVTHDPAYAGGPSKSVVVSALVRADPSDLWPAVTGLGDGAGWYAAAWLWRIRGVLDELAGGVGLRRGRRQAGELRVGDSLDFFRVIGLEKERELVLVSEMRMPGEGVLKIELEPLGTDLTRMRLTARFLPRGLAGLAYWYSALWLHQRIFAGMLQGLARAAGADIVKGPRLVKD